MLKTIIDVIEVDDDANIEVRLKLLNEIGTNEPVVTRFEDIYNCESNGNNENNLNNKNNSNNTDNENNKNNANNKNNTNNQNSTVTKSNISAQRCI